MKTVWNDREKIIFKKKQNKLNWKEWTTKVKVKQFKYLNRSQWNDEYSYLMGWLLFQLFESSSLLHMNTLIINYFAIEIVFVSKSKQKKRESKWHSLNSNLNVLQILQNILFHFGGFRWRCYNLFMNWTMKRRRRIKILERRSQYFLLNEVKSCFFSNWMHEAVHKLLSPFDAIEYNCINV